ncbi:MAG: hypothetical protein GX601_02000 [Anaerolineales bacterium]|nr:hypothetical protein [Anaerolineales bacterium]
MTSQPKRRNHDGLWLLSLTAVAALALATVAAVVWHETGGVGGVPLDDAWIHFQFARNLARGQGFSFNAGVPAAGSTAPLWTLILAGAAWLGGPFPLTGQALSALSFLIVPLVTYQLARKLTANRWAAWLAGLLVALNGRMLWAALSALETPLFAALTVLAVERHLANRDARRYGVGTAVLFALAAQCRPEGYLLFALALLDTTVVRLRRDGLRQGWRRLPLLPALAFGVLVIPYLAFSLQTSGHLLPNTYHAKTVITGWPALDTLSIAAQYLILDNPLILPFVLLGVGVLLRRAPVVALWTIGLPLVYAFMHVTLYQHGRYLIPLVPFNAVLAVAGLLAVRPVASQRRWLPRWSAAHLAAAITALAVAGTAWRLPTMARLTAQNVTNINDMHVALGRWLAEHTPPDALLAVNDIGAIGYLSERTVVDLAGLVTPEVIPLLLAPARDARLAGYLLRQNVDYVVIFPNWFPGLAARSDILEPIHEVTLAHNTIAGGAQMVVYRARWR